MGKERQGPDPRILQKLLVAFREEHHKIGELLDEIDALIDGKATIGVQLKAAEQAFAAAWSTKYSGAYMWRYTTDRPHLKRILKVMGAEEVAARSLAYIADPDPYLARARHPFGLFVSRINQYSGAAPGEFTLEAVSDCRHLPPCRSDQEHTRRKLAEVRA